MGIRRCVRDVCDLKKCCPREILASSSTGCRDFGEQASVPYPAQLRASSLVNRDLRFCFCYCDPCNKPNIQAANRQTPVVLELPPWARTRGANDPKTTRRTHRCGLLSPCLRH
jgi:hypothetical protein